MSNSTFPTTLDTFVDPTPTTLRNAPGGLGLAEQISLNNDATAALETKVGINSSADTTSLDYKLKNSGSIDPGHLHTPASLSGQVPISKGGTGQATATPAFNALSPATTKGDLIGFDGTNNVRVGVGTNGFVPAADSSQTAGWAWKDPNTLISATPAGIISMFAGAAAPTGWLLCQGQAVSRTTYAGLFTAIGTTYGAGDGSTTFNVPNFQANVPVGYKSADSNFGTLGGTGGEATHVLTVNEMPSHSHQQAQGVGSGSAIIGGTAAISPANGPNTSSTGGGLAHNNIQPYLTVNFIVKT